MLTAALDVRPLTPVLSSEYRGEGACELAGGVRPVPDSRAGAGRVELSRVAGRTVVTQLQAHSPLRLLAPHAGPSAWVFAGTYGGGLLAGDWIDLRVRVNCGATALLSTQASTKVYRSGNGQTARQTLRARVEQDALLALLPDPVTCFAGARYEQVQRFDVRPGGSLVLLDWLTSGRRAREERWAFHRYQSRNDIFIGSRHLFRDAIRLDAATDVIGDAHRMGRYDCWATAVLVGPRVAGAAQAIAKRIAREPIRPAAPLLFAASPLDDGVVLRVAGRETEQVGRWLREQLAFLPGLLGADPWSRKW